MKKETKERLNNDINCLRETIIGLATPKFCSYCGADHNDLYVEIIRGLKPDKSKCGELTTKEYDVEYFVICERCGKTFKIQPSEVTGLIDAVI